MTDLFWAALGLMLVFEGIMPFLAPSVWRDAFLRMALLTDAQLRVFGLASMCAGLLLIVLLH